MTKFIVRKRWPGIQMYISALPDAHVAVIALCDAVQAEQDIITDPYAFAHAVLPLGKKHRYNLFLHKPKPNVRNGERNATLVRVDYDDRHAAHVIEARSLWGEPVWTLPRNEAIDAWVAYGSLYLAGR